MKVWLVTTLLLLGVACGVSSRQTGDIDALRDAGVLRIAVRPGFHDRSAGGGVDEKELLRRLAVRLDLELRWIEASRHDQVAGLVVHGRADIAAMRWSPAAARAAGLEPTAPIDWVQDELLVHSASNFEGFGSLEGARLHLHLSRLTAEVRSFVAAEGLELRQIPEEVPLEEVVRRVRAGRYGMTIADSDLVLRMGVGRELGVLGPVAPPRGLVWAVRPTNRRLRMAVDHFLFAEKVLARGTPVAECRDLREVQQAGALRLVTRNSATTCTVEHGGLEGFEYDLASSFARTLGVRLELAIPPRDVDPVVWLRRGHGDLAALHEPVAPEDEGSLLATVPYRRVDLVAVMSARARPAGGIEDLSGVRIAASRPVASLCRLMPLAAPMRPRSPATHDAFASLLDVARGELPVAVVDEDAARLELANRPDLQRGPTVIPNVKLVWLLNPSSPRLHRAANRFIGEARRSGLVKQLVLNELGSWEPPRIRTSLPIPDGALSPYDELLKFVGRRHEIDWRLLASLMYEESRFDPEAVGPGGSAGLFQFMPFTWAELGVDDPHHPGEAAEAGARYLRRLMDEFLDLPLPDRVAMAVASYNVGPRHVFDARRLAAEMDFDPDRWAGSVETAMLLLDDPEVARQFPAGVCRCRRAVGYTRRILRRYAAYTEQFPPA